MKKCNICAAEFPAFLDFGLPPRPGRCPVCGGKVRHRLMTLLFDALLENEAGKRILDVGPSRVMTKEILNRPAFLASDYTAIDLRHLRHHAGIVGERRRFREMSVCALDFPDASFDLVLCNNVLPFIPDFRAALSEIARVLAPGGFAVLDTRLDLSTQPIVSSAECVRLDPEKFTPDFVEENGSAWFFGRDFLGELKSRGLSPWFAAPQLALPPEMQLELGLPKDRALLVAVRAGGSASRWPGLAAVRNKVEKSYS